MSKTDLAFCKYCGFDRVKKPGNKFCSRSCAGSSTRGTGKSYITIRLSHKGKRMLLHRWIWEQMTGETLAPGEVIHHKDENRKNNDFNNLMKFASQAEHARHHYENPLPLTETETDELMFWANAANKENKNNELYTN